MKIKKIKIVDFMRTETESKRKLHPAGYLILPDCQIARSGILQYGDVTCDDGEIINDGQVINVYRPPEALKECIKYFNNIPFTVHHPKSSAVDPETVRDVIVGTIGSNARIVKLDNGEVAVVADINVHDKDTIDIIQNNKMTELSAGYETAYRKQRGVTKGGQAYDAVQYYLMPNHVALVEEGRCGSECKVCDSNNANKEKEMRIKKIQKASKKATDNKFRYFIQAGDSKNGVIEISKKAFDELAKNEDAEIEELKEDEIEIENEPSDETSNLNPEMGEENEMDEKVEEKKDQDEESEEEEKKESSEESQDEDESMNDEDEEKDLEAKDEEGSDEIFEVELDDGTIGKMDKVAYEYMKRFVDMQKKGDSMTAAEIMKMTAIGNRMLGDSFAIDGYVTADGKFNDRKLKQDVIKKHMPGVVIKSLKNDEALNSMFECAVKSSSNKKVDWANDMLQLSMKPKATDSDNVGPVEKARLERLNKINGKETK